MANEEQRFYDAHDAVSTEGGAEPEKVELPPVDPVELEAKYLLGLAFPATKSDVIAAARQNDAPRRVFDLVEQLEEREYRDVTDLLGRVEELSGERGGVGTTGL